MSKRLEKQNNKQKVGKMLSNDDEKAHLNFQAMVEAMEEKQTPDDPALDQRSHKIVPYKKPESPSKATELTNHDARCEATSRRRLLQGDSMTKKTPNKIPKRREQQPTQSNVAPLDDPI